MQDGGEISLAELKAENTLLGNIIQQLQKERKQTQSEYSSLSASHTSLSESHAQILEKLSVVQRENTELKETLVEVYAKLQETQANTRLSKLSNHRQISEVVASWKNEMKEITQEKDKKIAFLEHRLSCLESCVCRAPIPDEREKTAFLERLGLWQHQHNQAASDSVHAHESPSSYTSIFHPYHLDSKLFDRAGVLEISLEKARLSAAHLLDQCTQHATSKQQYADAYSALVTTHHDTLSKLHALQASNAQLTRALQQHTLQQRIQASKEMMRRMEQAHPNYLKAAVSTSHSSNASSTSDVPSIASLIADNEALTMANQLLNQELQQERTLSGDLSMHVSQLRQSNDELRTQYINSLQQHLMLQTHIQKQCKENQYLVEQLKQANQHIVFVERKYHREARELLHFQRLISSDSSDVLRGDLMRPCPQSSADYQSEKADGASQQCSHIHNSTSPDSTHSSASVGNNYCFMPTIQPNKTPQAFQFDDDISAALELDHTNSQ